LGLEKDALDRLVENKRVVESAAGRILVKAECAGCVALGIAVNGKGWLFGRGQRGGEIDGSSCFANAALLVGDGDHASQIRPPISCGLYQKITMGCKMFHVERSRVALALAFHVEH